MLKIINNGKIPILEIGDNKNSLEFLQMNNLLNQKHILIVYINSTNKEQILKQIKTRGRGNEVGIIRKNNSNEKSRKANLIENVCNYVVINKPKEQEQLVKEISEIIKNVFDLKKEDSMQETLLKIQNIDEIQEDLNYHRKQDNVSTKQGFSL
ncbi:hypothetical protein [Spiroplasma endosymbiont of Nebria brevicollis]|uniref:hypothetical protein n=1 Tax=Spiroplasma endosymbiont of Nebria brevicollis TaxID=3066284 RepID=UPI00313AF8E0